MNNQNTVMDLTTCDSWEPSATVRSVEVSSPASDLGSEISGVQSDRMEVPMHNPRESAKREAAEDYWSQSEKIGVWTHEDVLEIPVDGKWTLKGPFNGPITQFMVNHAQSVPFPYVMSGVD